MRIMHIIDSLEIGGAERMLVEIANASVADGNDIFACVTRSVTTLAADLHPKIRLTALNRRRRFDLLPMQRVADDASRHCVDVFHAHGRSTLSFLAAVRTLRLTNIPVVFHDHYGSIEIETSVPHWFGLWGRHHVAQYVGVNAKLAKWAASAGIVRERIHVIDNALDLSRFELEGAPREPRLRQQFAIAQEVPLGIVIGGIRPDKGIDVLLNALALSQHRGAFKILLVGGERDSVYAAACRGQCSMLGLQQTAIFAGQRADAAALLSECDFAVLSSRSEASPLALIEYMAAGLPFVATRVGSIGTRTSSTGLSEFVPAGDVQALALALDNLLRLTPQQRRERGAIGQEVARRCFDIRQVMPQWYAVYDAAIKKKAPYRKFQPDPH
jgi:glycosyltransferase involved in cell wall biosynthesis